jgi:hypothetical protein
VSELAVPRFDPGSTWPTLGPQVCDWIETFLVFGPGDLHGQPARLSEEARGLVYSFYELHPQGSAAAGKRRFRRCAVSLRKGLAKTELGAWIAAAELHQDAPVRCDGFNAGGEPVGVAVRDPYIPMLAVSEDQSEGLAYATLRACLLEGPLAEDFDIGLAFITRKDGRGRCEAVAGSPGSREGPRTTFELYDETHGMTLPRLREAHAAMEGNLLKLLIADPWSLEITTAPVPGEGSVAEGTWEYAEQIAAGEDQDRSLFFFARWAGEQHDLSKGKQTPRETVRAAVLEASGDAAVWSNVDAIIEAFYEPNTDQARWERLWLNRKVQASRQVFSSALVKAAADPLPGRVPPRRTAIVLGFDGSRTIDSTGIIGTVIETGYQFTVGEWERPVDLKGDWEVPASDVDETMSDAFERWKVIVALCDPPFWEEHVNAWHGRWPDVVARYHTNQHKKMALTLAAYVAAWQAREVTHDGSAAYMRHLANARKQELNVTDERGEKLYVMVKERRNSPLKIDLAMAGCLSWQARGMAIAKGAMQRHGSKPGRTTVYMG